MEYDVCMVDLLHEAFPKIDERIIKATALEHEDDFQSAFEFLESINDEVDELENALSASSKTTETCRNPTTALEHITLTESDAITVTSGLSSSISQISLASLEEIVEEAKNDKDIVINLVEEVSDLRGKADQERAAALRAKSEAATSGDGLLKKADELRKKIAQKKHDNLMRMSEIYGEKAVLATEARGLKVRLEQVKLQKERAVTTLHEIKVMLQGCYGEAVKERLMAELEGREKEKSAQNILAAEEALMNTIEEESRKLDMEAEVCLQLKEFLSHHGSIIDSLQGEMCVLCEDVLSFKRQVNDGMWSSTSTASLPANMNPEGPYSFRKCKMSSTSSSQELGSALCSSKEFHSRMSASSSHQDTSDSAVERTNGSSQGYDKDIQQQLKFEEDGGWHQTLDKVGSSLCNSDAVISNTLDCGPHRTLQNSSSLVCDSRDSVTCNEINCEWHQKLMTSESLFGDSREAMSSHLTDAAVRSDFHIDTIDSLGTFNKLSSPSGSHSNRSWASLNGSGDEFMCPSSNAHCTAERFDFPITPRAGDGWVFTPKQMEESESSTSSSLIKVEADDYNSG